MSVRRQSLLNWFLFSLLACIWGSSFILMKEGLKNLDAYQVASLRMISGGVVLLPFGISRIKKVEKRRLWLILASGLLGSFIPAYLFCIAEIRISSSLAGFLNTLTPIFTIILGIVFFNAVFARSRLPGVGIAFAGMIILFLSDGRQGFGNILYSGLVILATICYALNVNIVNRSLRDVGSTNIAAIAFSMLLLPSLLVLYFTGFFDLPLGDAGVLYSIASATVLGIFGTAIASILFYILLKRSGTLFTSMVTYAIPFVALFWGILAGEPVTLFQVTGLIVILVGVYVTNR